MFPSDQVSEVRIRKRDEFVATRTLLNHPFNNNILNNLWNTKSHKS